LDACRAAHEGRRDTSHVRYTTARDYRNSRRIRDLRDEGDGADLRCKIVR